MYFGVNLLFNTPTAQVSTSAFQNFKGSWNATTNSPTLTSGIGTEGDYYVVGTAGNTTLDGNTDWQVGDYLFFSGGAWRKIDNTDLVTSVNGQTGTVVLTTTNIAEGSNLYFTDERAQDAVGAMVDATLVYVDATPSLGRAAITGDIAIASGSNASVLATVNSNVGTFTNATFTVNAKGLITAASSGATPVTSVTAGDTTITIGGTATAPTVALNLSNANTWLALQSYSDTNFKLFDDVDNTKAAQFNVGLIATGVAANFNLPPATTTAALTLAVVSTLTQTFSGTTTFSGATVTVGSSTAASTYGLGTGATLAATTKAINIGIAGVSTSTTNITLGSAVAGALGTFTINSPAIVFGTNTTSFTIKDSVFTLTDDGDVTKKVQFQLSGLTTGTTRILTVPDASDTLVLLTTAQSLTNKKLGSLTTNGFVTTTSSDGTLVVDTTAYASLSFTTIAVSGQSNVVADSNADTLTLVAGTGITITTNATTDTITFAGNVAVQSDQETGTSNILFVTPGVQKFHPSAMKAFTRFNYTAGVPTMIGDSYNVSSLTDTGTGDGLVNTSVTFNGTSHLPFSSTDDINIRIQQLNPNSATSARWRIYNNTAAAADLAGGTTMNYMIIGDLA